MSASVDGEREGLLESWMEATLGELLIGVEAGLNVKCDERPPLNDERGLVKISAVTWGRFQQEESKTLPISEAVPENRRIQPGDFLISRANTIELVGACVIVGSFDKRLYLSDKVLRLRFQFDEQKTWALYFLRSHEGRNQIENLSSGNQLSMRNLSQDALRSISIPLPPLPEQIRIADKLDALLSRVDTGRERLERVPKLLKRFRQSVLSAAVSGELTREWRGGGDAEWEETVVGECGSVSGGLTKNSNRHSLKLAKPYLRVANVHANRLEISDVTEIGLTQAEHIKTKLKKGDLLIVEGNGSLEHLGRVALWNAEIEDCVHQNHIIRWRTRGPLPKFILYWLLSPLGRQDLMRLASTTTGLHTLSITKVSAVPIQLPKLPEQHEIVRRVEALFSIADRLEARYTAASATFQRLTPALLAKAFRGELVEQDPNDEPASVLLGRIRAERAAAGPAKKSGGRGRQPAVPRAEVHAEVEASAEPRRRGRPPKARPDGAAVLEASSQQEYEEAVRQLEAQKRARAERTGLDGERAAVSSVQGGLFGD